MPWVEILAVGSELLTPDRVDTNSLWLTEQLNQLGLEVAAKSVIGDDLERLTQALQAALQRSEVVITTGGLGPTLDDLTRDAVAAATGCPLELDQQVVDDLRARFAKYGRVMTDNNQRQGLVPRGAQLLPNPQGTAPGLLLKLEGSTLVVLPGPPRELKPMFLDHVRSRLPVGDEKLLRAVLHVVGLGESTMDAEIAPIYQAHAAHTSTSILFTPMDLEIHLCSKGSSLEQCQQRLEELAGQLEQQLGKNCYSRGETMEELVGGQLAQRGWTLATAESLTGGLIGERITRVAGSSNYFLGSLVTYTEDCKQRLLGVPAQTLAEHSAVSSQVAEAMAVGARERTGATVALSATGYAGPSGGTESDPVGTVYLGLADAQGVTSRRFSLLGDRELVRLRASQAALDMLRRSYFL